jgi:hypothetical protein
MAFTKLSLKQKLVAGAAVAAIGGGGAVGAFAAGDHGQRTLQPGHAKRAPRLGAVGCAGTDALVASNYLGLAPRAIRRELLAGKTLAQLAAATSGKSPSGLIEAIVNARRAKVLEAAAGGAITERRARILVSGLARRVTARVDYATRCGAGSRVQGPVVLAAQYLGLSPSQLRPQLRSGRTLAQIADATPGKSAAGLIAALISQRKQMLAVAVAEGRLAPARENSLLARLAQRITVRVNTARVKHQR